MRTTLDIDDDVLLAAKELARRSRKSTGKSLSDLARKGLADDEFKRSRKSSFLGFEPFPKRGGIVTNELIDRLRETEDAG